MNEQPENMQPLYGRKEGQSWNLFGVCHAMWFTVSKRGGEESAGQLEKKAVMEQLLNTLPLCTGFLNKEA